MTVAQADSACPDDPWFPGHPEVHCAGQVWSSALWDIRGAIGGATADRLVIQSQFSLTPGASFDDASGALLAADQTLYGGAHVSFLKTLLVSRGLLDLERLDNTPAGANSLAVPGSSSGTLDASADHDDVYAFALNAGHRIIVQLSGGPGDFGLFLYKPGTTSLEESGSILIWAATPGTSAETFSYTVQQAGIYYLDVRAASGSGSYALSVLSDRDADCVLDGSDNCPTVRNAGQKDWDTDGIGDACDPSARATLSRASVRGLDVVLVGRMLPSLLPSRSWHIIVRRRSCSDGVCRYRFVTETSGAKRLSSRALRLVWHARRSGRYRFRAVVRHAGYEAARSSILTRTVGA
jgi:Bacterial pre-peptidase C-terminal domain